MKLGLAFRALFRVLRDDACAKKIEDVLADRPLLPPVKAPPARSEALTLLSTLQREGRLVDFLMEEIGGYADAQIGAAVRDIHRDCGSTLKRLFNLEPLSSQPENSPVEVPSGFDPQGWHLTGQVPNEGPFKGVVRHHGWKAAHCHLPEWNGGADSILIVAPVEVEVK